jgi:hypothetical protein
MNLSAQKLGRLGRGVPKRFSRAERRRRAKRLAVARLKRWPSPEQQKAEHAAAAAVAAAEYAATFATTGDDVAAAVSAAAAFSNGRPQTSGSWQRNKGRDRKEPK